MGLTEPSCKFPDLPRKSTTGDKIIRTIAAWAYVFCFSAAFLPSGHMLENDQECEHPTGYAVQCYVPGTSPSNLEPGSLYAEHIHETYGFYPNETADALRGKL